MGIELKFINAEGKQEVMDLGDKVQKIDFESMGIHSAEQVGAIKNRAVDDERTKLSNQYTEAIRAKDAELADLQGQLDGFRKSSSGKENETDGLRNSLMETQNNLKKLTDQIEQDRKDKATMVYDAGLNEVANRLSLVNGASSTFILSAKSAKVVTEDGNILYNLDSGGMGSIDQYAEQWQNSDVGKALTIAPDKGGTGSAPSSPGSPGPSASFTTVAEYDALRTANT